MPEIVEAFRRNGLINFAASISFLLVLALVPFLLFLLALLGAGVALMVRYGSGHAPDPALVRRHLPRDGRLDRDVDPVRDLRDVPRELRIGVGNLTTFFVLLLYVYASSVAFLAGVQADACLRESSGA